MQNVKWKTISVDFVAELLESVEFNIVMMVVNSASKRAHFISAHTTVTIRLFLHYI